MDITAPPARHILSYAQTLDGGGVERALLALARDWLAAGRRVTLVIGDARGPLAAELPKGVAAIVLGDVRYSRLLRALPDMVGLERPDVVFCPGNHYTGMAAWLRLRPGRSCPPIVAKLSNAIERPDHGTVLRFGYRRWLALHRHFVDALVAMDPTMAGGAIAAMRLPPDRVRVIANPPASVPCDAKPVALPTRRYLLGLGRLAPQKRWDRAIRALATIDGVDLLILGEGTERGSLEALARRLGIADRVHMPGYVADPHAAIAGAAAVVLASDYEGVPGAIREALAAGTPVVATRSSPVIDTMIDTPARGIVIPRDDPEALVAALRHRLAAGCPRPDPVPIPTGGAAEYLALFDQLVAGRSPSPS